MKKKWIVAIVIILMMAGIGLVFWALAGLLSSAEPTVSEKTVLVLELSGELPESAPSNIMMRLFEAAPMTFREVIDNINKASADQRVPGIWLKIENPAIGWAKVQDLQEALDRFKKKGKFVIATAEACNELDYACALPADQIYIPAEGFFEFNGFVAQATFLKDLFSKIGIEPEVENIGKYKSFGDMLKRNSMSDAQREEMQSLLDHTVDQFVKMVCKYRTDLDRDKVLALMEEGIDSPEKAVECKLLDGIRYTGEVEAQIKERLGEKGKKKLTTISGKKYRKILPESLGLNEGDQIAVIYAVGAIARGGDTYSPIFGRSMGSDPLIDAVQQVRRNKNIKALILRVDSPGGDGLASDLMWDELRLTDKEKPVIASMSDVAASGGYYIAMGCRKIVAEPGTITGSIGVVSAKFNMQKMYEFIGLRTETIKHGKWADMMSSERPMTPEEWERFRAQTRRFYDHFVSKAAEGRHKSIDALENVAQGRVWAGGQAIDNGLVDELGSLDKAVEVAKKEAGIPASRGVKLVVYPMPKPFFETFMDSLIESRQALETTPLQRELNYLGRFTLPGNRAILAIMPYQLVIK